MDVCPSVYATPSLSVSTPPPLCVKVVCVLCCVVLCVCVCVCVCVCTRARARPHVSMCRGNCLHTACWPIGN